MITDIDTNLKELDDPSEMVRTVALLKRYESVIDVTRLKEEVLNMLTHVNSLRKYKKI